MLNQNPLMQNISFYFKKINTIFLYNDYWYILILWTIIFFFMLCSAKIAEHIIHLGMSESDKKDSKFTDSTDGKQRKNVWAIVKHDHPFWKLLFIRQFGIIYNYLHNIVSMVIAAYLVISVASSLMNLAGSYNYKAVKYFLFSEYNLYGIAWFIASLFLALLIFNFYYNLSLKLFFGNLDQHYNEEMINRRSKTKLRHNSQIDIREFDWKAGISYDPTKYWEIAKQQNKIFLAVDIDENPIYFPKDKFNETNTQIIGKMGSGKGVESTQLLVQCLEMYDDFIIVFDPKNDEWAYSAFSHFAADNFYHVDLNRGAPAQINLFQDATVHEMNELLTASFGLGEKGDNADFYKTGDRKACRKVVQLFEDYSNPTLSDIYQASLNKDALGLNDKEGENFFNLLEELNELQSLQARKGLDLNKLVTGGKGVLFITGNLRDEVVVKAQKTLFLRLVQMIEKRDRTKRVQQVCILLDEIKYMISKSTLEAMGTLRDKKGNILFTHQSRGDLEISTKEIDGDTARKIIEDSAGIRLIYRTDNGDSAEWASDFTKGGLIDVERRNVERSASNAEMVGKETIITKQEANYISAAQIQNLPNKCGLIVADSMVAKIAYTSPVIVKKINKTITYFDKTVSKLDLKKEVDEHLKKEADKAINKNKVVGGNNDDVRKRFEAQKKKKLKQSNNEDVNTMLNTEPKELQFEEPEFEHDKSDHNISNIIEKIRKDYE